MWSSDRWLSLARVRGSDIILAEMGARLDKQHTRESVPSTLYTEEYFLTACEGYNEFIATEGEHLSRRLKAAFALAAVEPGMKVLDIGCGRGEILRHCANLGADAYGIDYAAVAVNMSQEIVEGVAQSLGTSRSVIGGSACDEASGPFYRPHGTQRLVR